MSELTEKELTLAQTVFEHLDTDKTNSIDRTELRHGLQLFGLNVSEALVEAIMSTCDVNTDGKLSLEEFKTLIQAGKPDGDTRAELEAALDTLLEGMALKDHDKISKEDFKNLLMHRGEEPLSDEDIDEIFACLDTDGDSDTISRSMLVTLFTKPLSAFEESA